MPQRNQQWPSFFVYRVQYLRCVFVVALLFGIASCTIAPLDGKVLNSTSDRVRVVGFWIEPGRPLQVLAGPTPEGPWSVLTNVTTNRTPIVVGSRRLYAFQARVQIPTALWQIPPSGCAISETYLGIGTPARQRPALISLEEEALSGFNPIQCLRDNDFNAAQCAGRRSPLTRLLVGNRIDRYSGDVVIASNADYDRHRCHDTIEGDLRVEASVGEVNLPELRNVTGSITLVHPLAPSPSNPLSAVAVPRVLPQLTHVDGDFIAQSQQVGPPPIPAFTSLRLDIQAPMLTRIDGDLALLHIDPGGANGNFSGLGALATIGGDLRFSTHADRSITALPLLREVSGDVELGGGRITTARAFDALERIDGDLDIPPTRLRSDAFSSLSSVGGDARLGFRPTTSSATSPNLGALTEVVGTLNLSAPGREQFALGAAPIEVGALTIENNNQLTTIQPNSVTVRGTGAVRIVNNPLLCDSHVLRLLRELAFAGWTGTSTTSGNDSSC